MKPATGESDSAHWPVARLNGRAAHGWLFRPLVLTAMITMIAFSTGCARERASEQAMATADEGPVYSSQLPTSTTQTATPAETNTLLGTAIPPTAVPTAVPTNSPRDETTTTPNATPSEVVVPPGSEVVGTPPSSPTFEGPITIETQELVRRVTFGPAAFNQLAYEWEAFRAEDSQQFYAIRTQQPNFLLAVTLFTNTMGSQWVGQAGTFPLTCSNAGTGICVSFDPVANDFGTTTMFETASGEATIVRLGTTYEVRFTGVTFVEQGITWQLPSFTFSGSCSSNDCGPTVP